MITATFNTVGVLSVLARETDSPEFSVNIAPPVSLSITMQVVGEQGPQGIQGPPGDVTASSIGQLSDVTLTNIQDGDLLVYQSNKFINQHKSSLVDGGNF